MGFLVLAMSTLTPLESIGVMTMKMISNTSITSTIGVTLISETGGAIFCFSMFDPSFARLVPGAGRRAYRRAARLSQLAEPRSGMDGRLLARAFVCCDRLMK